MPLNVVAQRVGKEVSQSISVTTGHLWWLTGHNVLHSSIDAGQGTAALGAILRAWVEEPGAEAHLHDHGQASSLPPYHAGTLGICRGRSSTPT